MKKQMLMAWGGRLKWVENEDGKRFLTGEK